MGGPESLVFWLENELKCISHRQDLEQELDKIDKDQHYEKLFVEVVVGVFWL